MFSVGMEHVHDEDKFDDCPVVRLYDEPDALAGLLKSMYDFIQYRSSDIDEILRVLPLANKYLLSNMRTNMAEVLRREFPTTWQAWTTQIREPHRNSVTVIKIARELDVLSFIPSAFYALLQLPFSTAPEQFDSTVDMATFCVGRDKLRCLFYSTINARWELQLCQDQRDNMRVSRLAEELRSMAHHCLYYNPESPIDMIKNIHRLSSVSSVKDLCKTCGGSVLRKLGSLQDNIWDQLPAIFGLVSWQEVQKAAD